MTKSSNQDRGYRGPQAQGGISHDVAKKAGAKVDPSAGIPDERTGRMPDAPKRSLDDGQRDSAAAGATGMDEAGSRDAPGAAGDSSGRGAGGTGQDQPHHGFGDRARIAQGKLPGVPGENDPAARNAPGSMSGGSREDRSQRVAERKQQEAGMGSSGDTGTGRADPAPGAPKDRGRGGR
jgi:hypothetical protein